MLVATTNSISTDAPYWDALRTWQSGPTTGRTLTALVSRPVISPSKLAVDGTTYGKNLRDAVPGKPFTWELNLDYWGEQSLDTISIGRLGLPEDVATTALFLVSPLAGYITGQTLVVDGGRSL